MRKLLWVVTLGLSLSSMNVGAAVTPAQQVRLDAAKSFMKDMVVLAKVSRSQKGKQDAATQARVRELSARVDFEALAKAALRKDRWAKFAPNDRERFRRALQELLEAVVYPEASKITADPDTFQYTVPEGKPLQVKIATKIQREKSGELMNENFEIILVFNNDLKKPLVVDTFLDGELISANLYRQFDRALQKQKFTAIVDKIESRVKEAKNAK